MYQTAKEWLLPDRLHGLFTDPAHLSAPLEDGDRRLTRRDLGQRRVGLGRFVLERFVLVLLGHLARLGLRGLGLGYLSRPAGRCGDREGNEEEDWTGAVEEGWDEGV